MFRIKLEIAAPLQVWRDADSSWRLSFLPPIKKPRDGKKKIIPRFLIILLIQQKSMGGPCIKVCVDAVDKIYTNLRIHFTELHWDAFTGIVNKIDWEQNIKTTNKAGGSNTNYWMHFTVTCTAGSVAFCSCLDFGQKLVNFWTLKISWITEKEVASLYY